MVSVNARTMKGVREFPGATCPVEMHMSESGQPLPKRDVGVTSVYPSISDMTSRRGERRKGP